MGKSKLILFILGTIISFLMFFQGCSGELFTAYSNGDPYEGFASDTLSEDLQEINVQYPAEGVESNQSLLIAFNDFSNFSLIFSCPVKSTSNIRLLAFGKNSENKYQIILAAHHQESQRFPWNFIPIPSHHNISLKVSENKNVKSILFLSEDRIAVIEYVDKDSVITTEEFECIDE